MPLDLSVHLIGTPNLMNEHESIDQNLLAINLRNRPTRNEVLELWKSSLFWKRKTKPILYEQRFERRNDNERL